MRFFLIFVGVVHVFTGCATPRKPPLEEYVLAKAALDAAQKVDAIRFSPGHWADAEQSYNLGETFFNAKEFEKAFSAFSRAVKEAEQAENSTRLLREQKGEIF